MEQAATQEKQMTYRLRLINNNHVDDTVFVEAGSIAEAEGKAPEAERVLVEPMVPCAVCGEEMGQTDPRTAHYPDGSPVYADPDHAYDGIRHIGCGR